MRLAIKGNLSLLLFCLIFFNSSFSSAQRRISSASQTKNVEQKINALLAKMTLAEKLGQLQQLDGESDGRFRPEHLELARKGLLGSTLNVRGAKNTNELQRVAVEQSRLKIPILFGFDVIHGYRTLFPIPLGETASWDLQAAEKSAQIAAREARSAGVHWTFAPMVDIARDPRWGRIMESAGEDAFLGAAMAKARVQGFQGNDYSQIDRVMACAKHFAAYGAAEGGRDYNTVDLSERTLREVYLQPFEAAKNAGAGSFMTSFNTLNGVPATANSFLLRQILRGEWKFDGLVVSDYTAVAELIKHGVARDGSEAAQISLNAGTDMEMVSRFYNHSGAELVKSGKVSMKTIDDAVRNVLRVKFRLGLFERPYADENLEKNTIKKPEFLQTAREISAKSFVLLKNEKETLPINKNVKKILVIGALADDKANTLDWWAGDAKAEDSVTILEGVRQKLGVNTKIRFEKGCELNCDSDKDFDKAVDAAKDSDFTIIVAGETRDISGEAASRTNLDLPGKQLDLIKVIHQTGKPYAVVLKNGRPLTINWLAENSPAILETWHSGTMGGAAIADVLFGDVNPSGKLPVTFPRNVGQIPLFYNALPTGRPLETENRYTSKYIDSPNTPLYPFGFGLSYTQFKIDNLRLDKTQIKRNENVKIRVDVENVGKRDGVEVVQLYVRDVAASVSRPVKELKGFQRISLKKGEKRTIEFTLTPKDLSFINREMKMTLEDGEFRVLVGNSSEGGLETTFTVGQTTVAEKKTKLFEPEKVFAAQLPTKAIPAAQISRPDDAFLEELSRKTFNFFWEQSDRETGLTADRARADGSPLPPGHPSFNVASSAATGFGLTGLCVAAERNWITPAEAKTRARKTLDFFANRAFHKNGWFYHWMDKTTGERRWRSEVSSIDTAIILGGVLSVRQCFQDDSEIVNLAAKIYERVDFKWMLNGNPYLLSHGWREESGFIPTRWDTYSEHALLYFLAIGSTKFSISPEAWYAWKRDFVTYGDYKYLAGDTPLFIHQFSQAWLDLRGRRERRPPNVDYYENSVKATRAQRQFFIDISKEFPTYSANIWGLTASDSQKGYIAWGAPPRPTSLDGTVVPCAAAGSLMFTPDISLAALREMKEKFGDKIYRNYGFVDAFNPGTGWMDTDVIGIDLGITLLSAENLRSGNVWFWFMQNPEINYALRQVLL
jgi:beta-glucosidase